MLITITVGEIKTHSTDSEDDIKNRYIKSYIDIIYTHTMYYRSILSLVYLFMYSCHK